ncbi:uncharacterized protein EMH_0027130 [Eimeria mitis]|uniref:Uncharacterized protein n=1 Tax=Eimeria mitis TaxID=44415 RepID=U6K357_9EIME|nr:uncharacterized protein EMH_0027130 [Eimeria mitis]CDJ30203.1 hypothetical protein, conserved [Eimeria mitis]
MQRGGVGGSPASSRSLSVSSDSDAVEEPAVLEEARKGSSAACAAIGSTGRSRISWVLSKSSQSSSSADSDHDSPRPRSVTLSSTSQGLRSTDRANGSRRTSSSRRPIRVSFMDECALSTSTGGIESHGTAEVALSKQCREGSKRPNASQFDLKTNIACRAQAVANANRNVAAMAAEKQAIDETQNPALDAMEHEVNGLHRQLNDVKESLHRRCLNILNSLVGKKWTIDTSDTLVKRMLRPSKWTEKSQVQLEAEEGQRESQDWFGPSANDVFGDCLSDGTESTWEEDEDYEQKALGFSSCEIPSIIPNSIASGLPQFLRREIGNRWLPTLFAEADVRISEYWKLENMRNREKAAWVYQGIQTEPKPYPWEEVPLEGKPLSPQEIAQQRKEARSRRHLSLEAERLLRGIGQGSGFDGDASTPQQRGDDCTIMNPKTAQLEGRSPAGDETSAQTTSSRCTVNPPGTRAIRRVR